MPQPRMLPPAPRPPVARGQKPDEPGRPARLMMPPPEQLGIRAANSPKIEMPPPEQLGVAARP
jgi:hypothetical protein